MILQAPSRRRGKVKELGVGQWEISERFGRKITGDGWDPGGGEGIRARPAGDDPKDGCALLQVTEGDATAHVAAADDDHWRLIHAAPGPKMPDIRYLDRSALSMSRGLQLGEAPSL
jgi:hypothetical protein